MVEKFPFHFREHVPAPVVVTGTLGKPDAVFWRGFLPAANAA